MTTENKIKCPKCQDEHVTKHSVTVRFGKKCQRYKCQECGHVFPVE